MYIYIYICIIFSGRRRPDAVILGEQLTRPLDGLKRDVIAHRHACLKTQQTQQY